METSVNLKPLIKEKYKIFHRLKKLQNSNKKIPKSAIADNYYKFYYETDKAMENIKLKHGTDASNEDYFEADLEKQFELLYLEMKADLSRAQSKNASDAAEVSSVEKDDNKLEEKSSIDSPQFDIKPFSGELTDWPDFRREYHAKVHLNSNLSNPQKFNILKNLLPMKVFEPIKNIYTYREDSGYGSAWRLLEETFSKRKNVEELLTTLMQQPSINGSSESIVQLLETTKKCLNGLMSWNVNTKNWDMVLIHILVQKLNQEFKTEWNEIDSSNNTAKTIFDFFNFLYRKLRTQRTPYAMSVDKVRERHCVYCQRKHNLWKCDKFESLSIDERLSFVRKTQICDRCLDHNHTISKCWKPFKCRICHSNTHHYLLHKNKQRSKSRVKLLLDKSD